MHNYNYHTPGSSERLICLLYVTVENTVLAPDANNCSKSLACSPLGHLTGVKGPSETQKVDCPFLHCMNRRELGPEIISDHLHCHFFGSPPWTTHSNRF